MTVTSTIAWKPVTAVDHAGSHWQTARSCHNGTTATGKNARLIFKVPTMSVTIAMSTSELGTGRDGGSQLQVTGFVFQLPQRHDGYRQKRHS